MSQYNLGVAYEKGLGVSKDNNEAAKFYRKAAEQGIAKAQLNLAIQYVSGTGVIRDYVQAYMWFNLAAKGGEINGKKGIDIVSKGMTSSQIAEAERLSKEWKARKN
jgi:uncharacterized protein